MILAVDPSVRSIGVALFDLSSLLRADRITVPVIDGEDDLARWRRAARAITLWPWIRSRATPALIVAERPQVYQRRGTKTKGDPNDLLGMCGVLGALAALYPVSCCVSFVPAVWKGQAPKDVMRPRILGALSPGERALTYDSHDAIDAVGIGLYYLGRLAAPVRAGRIPRRPRITVAP